MAPNCQVGKEPSVLSYGTSWEEKAKNEIVNRNDGGDTGIYNSSKQRRSSRFACGVSCVSVIVIKHFDRQVVRRDESTGALVHSADFTKPYYHCSSVHITRKKKLFFTAV